MVGSIPHGRDTRDKVYLVLVIRSRGASIVAKHVEGRKGLDEPCVLSAWLLRDRDCPHVRALPGLPAEVRMQSILRSMCVSSGMRERLPVQDIEWVVICLRLLALPASQDFLRLFNCPLPNLPSLARLSLILIK